MSGSLTILDEPIGANFYEKVGRTVTGPAVSMALDTASALTTETRESRTAAQKSVDMLRRIPTLKQLGELIALTQSDLDVRTPDGEVKYRKSVTDAIASLGSFRTAGEANLQSAVNAIVELKKQTSDLKNAVYVAVASGKEADQRTSLDAVQAFNKRWPEVAVTGPELTDYIRLRARGTAKTDYERVAVKKFSPLMPQPAAP